MFDLNDNYWVPAVQWIDEDRGLSDSIWGSGDRVAWAAGEPLLIAGPPASGKTTLLHNLIIGRLAAGSGTLLGLPIAPSNRPVAYVSVERQRQGKRALRRLVLPEETHRLGRLIVGRGPLPFSMAENPTALVEWAIDRGVGTLVIDGLGMTEDGLSDDATGSRVSRAFAEIVTAGIELVIAHHTRKAHGGNTKPNGLDDILGSRWLTAGAGSVFVLWPADRKNGMVPIEFRHQKSPLEPLGVIKARMDVEAGIFLTDRSDSREDRVQEVLAILDEVSGATAREVAVRLFGTEKPEDSELEAARKALVDLREAGSARFEVVGNKHHYYRT